MILHDFTCLHYEKRPRYSPTRNLLLPVQVEPPPPPPSKLLVLGQRRPRMALEVKVLNRIEGKLPGHVASLGKTTVEAGSVGLTVMELKPGGDGKEVT